MTSRYNARIAECRGDEFGYMEGDELELTGFDAPVQHRVGVRFLTGRVLLAF